MGDIPMIYDDPRPIHAIWYDGLDAGGYCTKTLGCDVSKIVAYAEHGQGDFVPYYAVYGADGSIRARVPGHMVTVVYATGDQT